MLHVLPPPNEHSPTAGNPWRTLRPVQPRAKSSSCNSFAAKKRKCFIQKKEPDGVATTTSPEEENSTQQKAQNRQRSISECYFAVKGAALVLPQNESMNAYRKSNSNGGDIQQHLQSMFYLLRPEDTLKMAVKLESIRADRTRYLVVVSCVGNQNLEESCLLGVDCNETTTLGLVLAVWADVKITLDGDGGFSVSSNSRHHIFKPVSVQAMWSALQTLHKASEKATGCNYFLGGVSHSWIEYYEKKISSDRSCLNEWHAMDDLESRRPPSPENRKFQYQKDPAEVTERNIRSKLREVMMTVDLDEVTSKHIRTRLEKDLHMDLQEYKSYIDQEMLTIMGQMDTSTEIFDHLYLGSEWNASNLEELQRNGVSHILNVTREIDNFFPGMFDYLNIRVYDEEGTELLKHWDTTYKFITDAKDKGSKVLVHCKMGVSRSASVVIAYIMKANNWKLNKAFEFVKIKRNCVQPNQSFMKQLETYQGILDASNHRHNTLWRSKSENNLKKQEDETLEEPNFNNAEKAEDKSSIPENYSEGQNVFHRPKSWSPDENIADLLFSEEVTDSPNISKNHVLLRPACLDGVSYSVSPNKALHLPLPAQQATEPVRFALGNDDSPNNDSNDSLSDDSNSKETNETEGEVKGARLVKRVSSIKDRINELEILAQLSESKQGSNRDRLDLPEATGLVLNLASQFESVSKSNPSSPQDEDDKCEFSLIIQNEAEFREQSVTSDIQGSDPVISQTKLPATKLQAVLVRPETWPNKSVEILRTSSESMLSVVTDEASETRRHSTNDLQSCKSESDVIMRLRVNNESKDLNVEAIKELNSRDVDKAVTSNSSTYTCNNDSTASPISTLNNNLETHKQSDIFSTNLDNIFNNEERKTAEKRSSQIISSCKLNSDIAISICDSAISTQTNELKSGNEKHFDCNVTGTLDNSKRTMTVPRNNSKFGLPTSDLTPPQSWRTKLTKLPSNVAKVEDKCCDEDCLLKRASSLDGSLPSHSKVKNYAQRQAASEENRTVQDTSEIPSVIVIQRSQSLKNSSTSCKHSSCEAPKVFRIHGPKPYKKSPNEKQAPCILDSATIIANNEAAEKEIVHYASAPILYKDNSQDYQMVPKSSTSQPNIITSCSINCNSNILKKNPLLNNGCSKEYVEMNTDIKEFDVGSKNYASIPADNEVPSCPGIVKQHKEVLENKIASSGVSNWPAQLKILPPIINNSAVEIIEQIQAPTNVECKQQCDKSEEWKILQSKLQLQMQSDAPDEGSPSGKVKRLTQKMEKATGSNLPTTSISLTAAQPVIEVAPDLIIIDQNGKEILPDLQHLSVYSETIVEAISPVVGLSSVIASPVEDKSVKTLVGKFEVKEKPLRNRYFSETEVENLSRGVAAESEMSPFPNSADCCSPCNLAGETCNHQSQLTRKRSADCEIFGQSTKENFKSDIGSFGETKLQENRNTSLSVKDKIPQHRSPLSSSVTGTSDEELIAVENGVPHRKLRKAQGKSHPLSKLQNSNKQRHVSPFYYTM